MIILLLVLVVEGVWFDNQFKWYTIENLLNPIKTYFTTTSKPVLEGTSAEEIFIGDGNVNWFIGNGGGDTYNGNGEYDQVEYYGADAYRSNFIFSKNLDNSVSVTSPYGAETYNSIEGVYFGTEEKWYAVEALILIQFPSCSLASAKLVKTLNHNVIQGFLFAYSVVRYVL